MGLRRPVSMSGCTHMKKSLAKPRALDSVRVSDVFGMFPSCWSGNATPEWAACTWRRAGNELARSLGCRSAALIVRSCVGVLATGRGEERRRDRVLLCEWEEEEEKKKECRREGKLVIGQKRKKGVLILCSAAKCSVVRGSLDHLEIRAGPESR